MPLLFVPKREALFLWGEPRPPPVLEDLALRNETVREDVVGPDRRRRVEGVAMPLLESVSRLAMIPTGELPSSSGSIATWALAGKLALDLISRERVVPTLLRRDGRIEARWGVALSATEDAAQVAALARSMPPSAHAVPAPGNDGREVWATEALLRAFLDATADAWCREAWGAPEGSSAPAPSTASATSGRKKRAAKRTAPARTAAPSTSGAKKHTSTHAARDPGASSWEPRWQAALLQDDPTFEPAGFAERTVVEDVEGWSRPALGTRDRLRACFRLELPEADEDHFTLRFLLQSPEDPSLLVTAAEAWNAKGRSLAKLGRAFRDPQESLLEALGRAVRLFPPIAQSLSEARPEALALDPASAWAFLNEGAPALSEAGFGVIVPSELTPSGQRRLRLRMRVSGGSKVAGAVEGTAGLSLDALCSFEWEAALGDTAISARELQRLAKQKAPLVRYRGTWVAVDPQELDEIKRRLSSGPGRVPVREALAATLAGETRHEGTRVDVVASGPFADLASKLREGAAASEQAPPGLHGVLRSYQARGLAWLDTMASLGLGACLADDMGLGKTVQLLAFLLRRLETRWTDRRPALLVVPTSVLGNWEREAERFAPDLHVVRHHGPERAARARDIPRKPGTLVLTSYALLRRDIDVLGRVEWSTVALDEAQNIKNAASATAGAARSLNAAHRFALTGTPLENRLAELWSIFEFLNPGLLGPAETFRREYAVPVERYGDEEAGERLRKIVSPLLLRRSKTDPRIVEDLPPKDETRVVCTLTREQATLYRALVDEEMRRIESADEMERRGRVLALLTGLKQICNHPAQYLGDSGPLPARSGKLERLSEMLEEAVAAGDKALVFTQFREMGERLQAHLTSRLGIEIAWLHGGTPRKKRDEMVQRFQQQRHGPSVLAVSLKAGGTGLNLTAASQVFHFDRWWNPAVEDQATDRAHRIGQKRVVQVHKLVCAGTVEERIDRMLEHKRDLAEKVVGTGEQWITELDDDALRELVSLRDGSIASNDDDHDEEGEGSGGAKDGKGRKRSKNGTPSRTSGQQNSRQRNSRQRSSRGRNAAQRGGVRKTGRKP